MFPLRDLNPSRIFAAVTLALIIANVAVFFFWQPFGRGVEAEVGFLYERAAVPCEITEGRPLSASELEGGACGDQGGEVFFPGKNIWLSVLVSMFLHANVLHLAGNMWYLWIFGDNIEERFGRLPFLAVYLFSGFVATAGFVLLHPGEVIPIIGASGAIAGVLGAYLVLFPLRTVLAVTGFWILPLPAVIFMGVWFVGQFFVVDIGVAWEAHVVGFIAGAAVALIARPVLRPARATRRSWRG